MDIERSDHKDVCENMTVDEGVNQEAPENPHAAQLETESKFKTPSFAIPSKKKVKADIDVFRVPDALGDKTSNKDPDKSTNTESNSEAKSGTKAANSGTDVKTEIAKRENEAQSNTAPSKPCKVLSPAEQLKHSQAALPYKEPTWGGSCEEKYSFEVIKNGAVIDTIDLATSCFQVVGRLPSCNIPMEHPSLSRHHAVIQYSKGNSEEFPKGWYLFDLDSTHGTWINKNKVPPKKFHRLHVGYVMKFGGSTRLFILQGPDSDREDESELSATEMKEQREKQKKEAELIRQAEIEEAERKAELLKQREEQKGCSWGIDEEDVAEEEDENTENPFASIEPENEALYINDPKKALNGYFEREGLDLPEYEFHEAGFGKWKCSIELPIDTSTGEPMIAEAVVSGKRKEAVIACALEACRILDRHGELRKAAQESRKRKQKNWEDDDFYDSDEDTFLDRTGAIEKKRELRKMKVGKSDKSVETFDTLMKKHESILKEISDIEEKLEVAKAQAASMESEEVDALDAYMSAIKSGMMDTKTKMKLKRQLMELKQEEQKVRKLANIAKPAALPEIKVQTSLTAKKPSILSNVGRIIKPSHGPTKLEVKNVRNIKPEHEAKEDCEVEEEEEETEQVAVEVAEGDVTKDNKGVNIADESSTKKHEMSIDSKKMVDESSKSKTVNQADTKHRMKGPTLPLAAVLEKLQEEADSAKSESVDAENGLEKRNKRKASKLDSKSGKKSKTETGYKDNDPDYAVWLPPENQSGDGKTHLNEKLGY